MRGGDRAPSVGGYWLGEELGRGGMGTVHRAVAPDGREVALKRLNAEVASADAVARCLREARVRIDHPNVVEVVAAGVDVRGQPWVAFELLRGESLAARLERGAMEPGPFVRTVGQVCRGLAAAHAAGVVHRDVKPSNVFLCDDGVAKVLDFGVARLASEARWLTATGDVLGTPAYLAPEQARGEPEVDARADVWGVGVILHRGLTGVSPFERGDLVSTLAAVLEEEPPALVHAAPQLPRRLCDAVDRCLRRDPAERWPGADALADVLDAIALPGDR